MAGQKGRIAPVPERAVARARGLRLALLSSAALILGAAFSPLLPQHAAAQSAEQPISVGAGSLTRALNDLAAQTGLQIVFDASLANGKTTSGVRGAMTPHEALDALLAGSGVTASFAGDDQFSLASDNDPSVDTIEIYGARDATTLQDASASVGVIDSEAIDYGQMTSTHQTLRRLANVEKGATQNTGIVVRGMNFEGFSPAGAPMGSVYVDGILQSRYNSRFGARGLWDAEQVEVYRGPQSTLSGRAATAGALYVKTKDPTYQPEAVISGTVGDKDLAGGAFVYNTPIGDDNTLALRVSGSYEERTTEIAYPNYTSYRNYDDFRTELTGNLRAKLLIEPASAPDTRALLTYSVSRDRPNERLVGPDIGDRGDFYQFPTFAEFRMIDVHNVGLEVTHDITSALRLTSQSSLSHGITARASVDNGSPGVANAFTGKYKDSLFSQELRLNYDQGGWSGVAGVFGSYEHQDSDFFARLTEWGIEQEQFYVRKTANLAAFGEATYEILPSWKVTLGGRVDYLSEETDETDILTPIGFGSTIDTNGAEIREVNFVPKLGLAREFGENHVLGFTFSQGFRTGGFFVDPTTGEPMTYDPEFADNYEIYYKGKSLDDRLTLNANVFYTKYKDQQVETYPDPSTPTGTIVSNAASSYATGFEFEPSLEVNANLSLFASVGYLHTRFEDFNHSTYGDMAGESFPEAPEWSVAAGGLYKFDSGFYVGADAKFLSDYNARFSTNAPLDHMDSRVLVNLQAGFRTERWELNAFAENLLDKNYYTMTDLESAPVFGQAGPSRLFGMNAKAKF